MESVESIITNERAHNANTAIDLIERAGERLALAVARIAELADERPIKKSEAIRRIMGTENPETGKPHSASSAEKIVESDAEFAAFCRQQRDAEVEKHRAYAAYEATKLRAQLAVMTVGVAA